MNILPKQYAWANTTTKRIQDIIQNSKEVPIVGRDPTVQKIKNFFYADLDHITIKKYEPIEVVGANAPCNIYTYHDARTNTTKTVLAIGDDTRCYAVVDPSKEQPLVLDEDEMFFGPKSIKLNEWSTWVNEIYLDRVLEDNKQQLSMDEEEIKGTLQEVKRVVRPNEIPYSTVPLKYMVDVPITPNTEVDCYDAQITYFARHYTSGFERRDSIQVQFQNAIGQPQVQITLQTENDFNNPTLTIDKLDKYGNPVPIPTEQVVEYFNNHNIGLLLQRTFENLNQTKPVSQKIEEHDKAPAVETTATSAAYQEPDDWHPLAG